jgi:hypothetical protein
MLIATSEIKCANCVTTVHRTFVTAASNWLCPDCDPDRDEVSVEDESFGSEKQLRDADAFNGESTEIHYIADLKAKGLFGDHFSNDKPARRVLDQPGGWFADDSVIGPPTRPQMAWTERRLNRQGLADNQLHSQQDIQALVKPILEDTEFQDGIQNHQFDRRLDRRSWHSDARRRASGSDLSNCHAVRTRAHQRKIPAWTLNDEQVRKVLNKLFPRHGTGERQRALAGRWLRIVYLYFRVHQWVKTIAEAVGCSVRAVEGVVCRARKVGGEMFGTASSAVGSFGDADIVTLQPPALDLQAA